MPDTDAPFEAFSADGHEASWTTWDGKHAESMSLRWENEAWTATGQVASERVQYVLRIAPTWHVRQFLLFRDLDEPDLWLAIDARRRWGEVNGAFRPELAGCADIDLGCTPFAATIPIRRLGLGVGESTEIDVISVDVETLAAVSTPTRYERNGPHTWTSTSLPTGVVREFEVDDRGLVVIERGHFRRAEPA
jgi:hypothetical protein